MADPKEPSVPATPEKPKKDEKPSAPQKPRFQLPPWTRAPCPGGSRGDDDDGGVDSYW